ncbi:tetratricopeptide repeat protein [Myxococcota bacterium]|nr:tetratricopeptide repeat protein [Myxococcota bacterium]
MTTFLIAFLILTAPDPTATVLLEEGNKSYNNGDMARAATLYEAYLQLSVKDRAVIVRMAELFQSSGRNDQAVPYFRRITTEFCGTGCKENCLKEAECKRHQEVLTKISRDSATDDQVPLAAKVPEIAAKIFSQAVELKKNRKFEQARDLLTVALKLDPDLVGVYRHLGEVYEQLKDQKQADEFYLWYLRVRPAGPLAAQVRTKLSKAATETLAKITLTSSWGCYIVIGSESLTDAKGRALKTPIKELSLPAGRYGIGFVCQEQHLARRIWVDLAAKENRTQDFAFGTIAVKLNPWARILAAANIPDTKPQFMDLGLFDVIGLPVGSYTLKLDAFDKSKTKTLTLEVKPKESIKITQW